MNSFLRLRLVLVLGPVLLSWLPALATQDPTETAWTATGNLSFARVCCAATLLPNGEVLITGGYGGSTELAATELYNPKVGAFTHTADLAHARSNHTATLLLNGQVLVVGGQSNGNTLASAELYNPSTGTWTHTGDLHIARSYHTATLLNDGDVLVVGGIHWASPPVFAQGAPPGSALDIAELYDPSTGKWTVVDSLHTARYTHTATLLKNGDVLVAGGIGSRRSAGLPPGFDPRQLEDDVSDTVRAPARSTAPGNFDAVASAEIYNHITRTWSVTENLLNPRFNHTATLLPDGQVLVTGGQSNGRMFGSSELFNVSTGTWKPTGSMQTPRNGHTASLLPGGQVLVAGGANDSGVLTSSEIYDPSLGTWRVAASLNTMHALHTATLLRSGKVLIAGGCYALGLPIAAQASAELYDPAPASSAPIVSSPAPATQSASPPPPLAPRPASPLTIVGGLVVFTVCIVIITACAVVLLAVWLVFVVVQRWCK